MDKAKLNYLVDAVAGVSFLMTAVTGLIIKAFLPPGEGRGGLHATLWGYGRHDWGEWHDWFGIIMIIAVAVHFVLHWQWVVATTKCFFAKKEC